MPRNYIRKTTRGEWSEDAMLKALDAVKNGMPYRTASTKFKVPVMSLKRRAKGKNKEATGAIKYLGGKKTVFTIEQENELVMHIKDMETRMYGLTRQAVLSLAYQLAIKNNIVHPFRREKAGCDWLRGFRRRHPDITLRAPESTSIARARAFNKPVVEKFYKMLKEVQTKKNFACNRIYNVDETGISTVPTKNTKVFAQTGRKQVARATASERGETTTAVICMSAAGNFIPPMFIFRRVRMKNELMDGAPPGSIGACNISGWMKLDIFTKWFDHFLHHTKPSAEDPVLLILDGHLSHTKNLDVILKARDNHVTIICLPPHCTHKLQPLDVSVMYPLSVYHNQALEKWLNNNNGRVVGQFQIAKIFGEAYLKAAVPLNAINGFAKTGIYPFNPDVFTEADFLAAETTNMELDEDICDPNLPLHHNSSSRPETPIAGSSTERLPLTEIYPAEVIEPARNKTPSPLGIVHSSRHTSLSPVPSTSHEINRSVSPSILDDSPHVHFSVPPAEIQPLPKMVGKRSHLKRKPINTSVLTSTPYKVYLEEEIAKKTEKENKKIQKTSNVKKPIKKQKGKGKGIGKGISNRKKKTSYISESESSEEKDDAECLYCTEIFSKDSKGEGWIQCCVCKKWGHEACAGIDDDDVEEFTCDLCKELPGRKRLDF